MGHNKNLKLLTKVESITNSMGKIDKISVGNHHNIVLFENGDIYSI